jgi:hypothetical protein
MLAAVGVTFLACVAINKTLRERGYFEQNNMDEAPLKDWLDLVGWERFAIWCLSQGQIAFWCASGSSKWHNTAMLA